MNGAAALVKMLADYGVEVVFGVPGDTNLALYEALRDCGGRPRHILCRDERSAVFMADCYARLSGKPGVVEVPSGAGALYALPGIAEGNQSSVPLLLLVNDIPRPGAGRGTLTELPVEKLFEPISKRSETLGHVAKLPEMLRRAFREATGGRPGAVVLALPEDLLYEELPGEGVSLHIEAQCTRAPAFRSRPDNAAIGAALAAILAAERPLLVAGGGANRSGAGAAVAAFAERLRIPVVTTITGQGVLRDDHELAIGIIGDNGFHPHAVWALGRADLVIYAGCRMGSVATMHWQWPVPHGGTRIVQIDLCPETIGNTYPIDYPLVGDAAAVLEALVDEAPSPDGERNAAWIGEINARRRAFWEAVEPALTSESVPLRPERVMESLNRHLPSPVSVISDAGTATPYSTRFLRLHDPDSKLVIPRFFGGLGYAIPGVVGAWLAAPRARPVALFGDGSLGMSAGELETIARLDVPVVMIHFNNACFGWIKAAQRITARARHSTANEPSFDVDFSRHDMSRLAEVYGIRGYRIATPAQLEAALTEAFAADAPAFLDIAVESIADRLPPVFSWLRKAGVDPEAIDAQAVIGATGHDG